MLNKTQQILIAVSATILIGILIIGFSDYNLMLSPKKINGKQIPGEIAGGEKRGGESREPLGGITGNRLGTPYRIPIGAGRFLCTPQCNDGIDNDHDGYCDYNGCVINEQYFPSDIGCSSKEDNNEIRGYPESGKICKPQCSDGLDNDWDGKVDYPVDPECFSASDNNELPKECPPITIRDGENYFGDQNWSWILRNLDQIRNTEIISSILINGPTVGIANKFNAIDLNGPLLRERTYLDDNWYKGISWWNFPNSYFKLGLWDSYPDENDPWEGNRKYLGVTTKLETFNTLNTIGVPEEYRRFLEQNANVISISTNAVHLAPYNTVPSIMLNYQLAHLGIGEGVYYDNETSNSDYTYFYANLQDVNEDYSLDFNKYRVDCDMNYNQCNSTLIGMFNLPLNSEQVLHYTKIYNYKSAFYTNLDSGNYNPRNYLEWANIYYSYLGSNINNTIWRTELEPTDNLILQSFKPTTSVGSLVAGRNYGLIFYKSPRSRGYIFADIIDFDSLSSSEIYPRIDFYYWNNPLTIKKIIENINTFLEIDFNSYISNWPLSSEYSSDDLSMKFKLDDNGRVSSLGLLRSIPEESEFYYRINDQNNLPLRTSNIGLKNVNLKSMSGIEIAAPNPNHGYYEGEKILIPHTLPNLYLYLQHNESYWLNSAGIRAKIGREAFTDFSSMTTPYTNHWLYSPWITHMWYRNANILRLKNYSVYYNGLTAGEHLMYDSLVFGTNSPRIESSLTSGKDEYGDKLYVETRSAYNPYNYPNEGMKYISAFKDPIDLRKLSEANQLILNFLGKKLKIVGYENPNTLKIVTEDVCPIIGDGCGNGICDWYSRENYTTCPQDCLCGNGRVDMNEECDGNLIDSIYNCSRFTFSWNNVTIPGIGQVGCYPPNSGMDACKINYHQCAYCGNGYCELYNGENYESCPWDCMDSGGGRPICGDGVCNESPILCPQDCGIAGGVCGDGTCDRVHGECRTCREDCAGGINLCIGYT